MNLTRKTAVALGTAGAAIVLTASAAFACLTTKGSLTISGATTGATVIGKNTQMGFCSNPTSAASQARGSNITVTVAKATCGTTTQLPAKNTYQVRLNSSTSNPQWLWNGSAWVFQTGTGCWAGGVTYQTLTTSYSVNSNGDGSASLTVPSDANVSEPNEAAGVCVGDGTNGIFAPLRIT